MVRFCCPACAKVLKADEKAAGREVPCPKCGVRMRVPGGVPVPSSPAGPTELWSESASGETKTLPPRPARRRRLPVGYVLVFLLGMLTMGGLYQAAIRVGAWLRPEAIADSPLVAPEVRREAKGAVAESDMVARIRDHKFWNRKLTDEDAAGLVDTLYESKKNVSYLIDANLNIYTYGFGIDKQYSSDEAKKLNDKAFTFSTSFARQPTRTELALILAAALDKAYYDYK